MHKKFGEDLSHGSGDIWANRQTHRHGHHNTPLLYRGRVKIHHFCAMVQATITKHDKMTQHYATGRCNTEINTTYLIVT